MTKKILTTLTIIFTAISAIAEANDVKQDFIVVFDPEKVAVESLAGKDLTKKLESSWQKFQKKFTDKENELQKEKDSIQKKQSSLSKEAFEKAVKEFQEKASNLQKNKQEEGMDIERLKMSGLEEIDNAMKEVTKNLSDKKGFSIALPASTIIFYDNKLDISDEVLTGIDKKITKVSFK